MQRKTGGSHVADPLDPSVAGAFINRRQRAMRPTASDANDRIQNVDGANLRWRQNQERAVDTARHTDGVQVYVRSTASHGGDNSVRIATLDLDHADGLKDLLGFQQDRQRIETVSVILDSGAQLSATPEGKLSFPKNFNPRDLSDADYRFLCMARDQGLVDDQAVLGELANQAGQVHLTRQELQLNLPADTPPWLRAIAGVAGNLAALVVGQYETHFHARDWQAHGMDPYPALTAPSNIDGNLSRENNNPIAFFHGGGSGGHPLNTAELITLYRTLGNGLQEGVEGINRLISGPGKPKGAEDSSLQAVKQALTDNLQQLHANPEVLRALDERVHLESATLPPGVDPNNLKDRLTQALGDSPLTRRRIDAYVERMGALKTRLDAPATTETQARQILDQMDAATNDLVATSGGLPSQAGQQVKACASDFLTAYMANRTLTTMGEIIEVTHNVGAAFKNVAFPMFSVLPKPGPDGQVPHSGYSVNDIGDRLGNTAGVTAKVLQQCFDRGGIFHMENLSPLAQNSGGSFTPTGVYLPDYPNVRPAFDAGIAVNTDAGGASLHTVVRTVTGEGGLEKTYLPIHVGLGLAGGNDEYSMTLDANAPDMVVPNMGPATSYMSVGANLNPGHFFAESTSPFVQNSTVFARYTAFNPTSSSAMTEHFQAGSPLNAAPDTNPARFRHVEVGYHVPLGNFIPRLGPGGVGGFFDDYFGRLRVGATAGYGWGTVDSRQHSGATPGQLRFAPYLSAQVASVNGTEGFWGTMSEIGLGIIRSVMTVGLQAGVVGMTGRPR